MEFKLNARVILHFFYAYSTIKMAIIKARRN